MAARAQDHVTATGTQSFLPELHADRPLPDRDLAMALQLFNGQNVLNRDRTIGVFERPLAPSLRPRGGQQAFLAEGVVLRSDAFITPDFNGVATVLTVLPSAILAMPDWYPPPAVRSLPPRRGVVAPTLPPRPAVSTLRFVLAGGTIYFDDNNGAKVRQTGVRYPAPGEALIFFGETIAGQNSSQPPSSVLLLAGACALQGRACMSIDGNPMNSDTLAAQIPGGLDTALAFHLAGAAIADPTREGIRGLAGSLESRYNLGIGDLRKQAGPELPMNIPFAPATADETFVRAHVLETDASLTLGGLGVLTHTLVGVDRILMGPLPKEHTIDVVQRGGFVSKDDSVLAALTTAEYPLVEGGDYFLTVGRTSDNRWELRSAWRVIHDQVFSLDRSRTQTVSRDGTAYWKSTAAFLKTLGLQ